MPTSSSAVDLMNQLSTHIEHQQKHLAIARNEVIALRQEHEQLKQLINVKTKS